MVLKKQKLVFNGRASGAFCHTGKKDLQSVATGVSYLRARCAFLETPETFQA